MGHGEIYTTDYYTKITTNGMATSAIGTLFFSLCVHCFVFALFSILFGWCSVFVEAPLSAVAECFVLRTHKRLIKLKTTITEKARQNETNCRLFSKLEKCTIWSVADVSDWILLLLTEASCTTHHQFYLRIYVFNMQMISIKNIPKTRHKSDGTFSGMFFTDYVSRSWALTWTWPIIILCSQNLLRHKNIKKIQYYHLVFRSMSCSPRSEFLCRVLLHRPFHKKILWSRSDECYITAANKKQKLRKQNSSEQY